MYPPVRSEGQIALSALVLSLSIFALILCGIACGTLLRRMLPEQHLSKEAQDTVRLGAGLVATMAALVLGLLIASAKTTYDTQSTQVKQITANLLLLDTTLSQYGPEAQPIRTGIRATLPVFVDKLWEEKHEHKQTRFEALAGSEKIYVAVQSLEPKNELQKSLRSRAVQTRERYRTGANAAVRGKRRDHAEAVSRYPHILAGDHLHELQSVHAAQCDRDDLSGAVGAVGLWRDLSDRRTQPAIYGADDDRQRALAKRARSAWPVKATPAALIGTEAFLIVLGFRLKRLHEIRA